MVDKDTFTVKDSEAPIRHTMSLESGAGSCRVLRLEEAEVALVFDSSARLLVQPNDKREVALSSSECQLGRWQSSLNPKPAGDLRPGDRPEEGKTLQPRAFGMVAGYGSRRSRLGGPSGQLQMRYLGIPRSLREPSSGAAYEVCCSSSTRAAYFVCTGV